MANEKETNQKKFSNWLQGVHSLNLTKAAFHEYVMEKWKEEVLSWKKDIPNMKNSFPTFLECVANNRIKVLYEKDASNSKKKSKTGKWRCDCDHPVECNKILDKILALQQKPGFNIVWTSNLCESHSKKNTIKVVNDEGKNISENIPKSSTERFKFIWRVYDWVATLGSQTYVTSIEYYDIFDGCDQTHIWCIANMFMQHGKIKTNISNTGPGDTDASMFFKMMKNCKLFGLDNDDYLYEEVIVSRDKLHHTANSRLSQEETEAHLTNMINLLKKFKKVPACKDTIKEIEKMLQETVMSMAVKKETLKKLTEEALQTKKEALEVDIEITKSRGFRDEDTEGMVDDINVAIAKSGHPSAQLNICEVFKSRQDLQHESNTSGKDHIIATDVEKDSEDVIDQENKTTGESDEEIDEKTKETCAEYIEILTKVDLNNHNQLCAIINRNVIPMVNKLAENDEHIKEKVEEVKSLERKDEDDEMQEESNATEGTQQPSLNDCFKGIESDMPVGQVCNLRVTEKSTEHDYLTWCRISSDELLVADRMNKRVIKLGNQLKLVSSLRLDDMPYNICYIGDGELAALLLIGKLVFVDVKDDMKITKSAEIKNNCVGMHCHADQLFMVDSNTVYVYDLEGYMQRVLYTNKAENNAFRNLTFGKDNQFIYITCLYNGLITIDMSGNLIGTYKDSDLCNAWGVSVDEAGNVLVCGYTSQIIVRLSSDGQRKVNDIDNKSEEEVKVTTLFFDKQLGLLLASGSSGSINVSKL